MLLSIRCIPQKSASVPLSVNHLQDTNPFITYQRRLHLFIWWLYYELNDNVQYQNLILQAMQLSPLNAIYYHDYAYYLRLRANAHKLSQKYFLIAIKLSRENNELYIRNFICLLKALKKYKMARVYMDKILGLVNSNNELSINLLHARLMIDTRNLHKAKSIYESLIDKYEHNWKVHSCFGTFLILILDFKNAEIHYRQSLTKCYNPRNLFNYICLMHSMNRFRECMKYLLQLSIKCNLQIHKEQNKIQQIGNDGHNYDESIFFCRGAQNLGEIPSQEQIENLSAECYETYARILLYFGKNSLSEKYFKMSLKLDQQNEVAFGGYMLLKMELHCYEAVKYLYDKGLFYINRYLPNPRPFLLHVVYVYTLCHKLRYGKGDTNDVGNLVELFKEIDEKDKEKIVPEPVDIDLKEIGIEIDEDEYGLEDDEKQKEREFVFISGVKEAHCCLSETEVDCICEILNEWMDESDSARYGRLLSVDEHYLHKLCGLSLLFGCESIVMDGEISDEDNKYLVLNHCKDELERALYYRPFCVETLCCLYVVVCYLSRANKVMCVGRNYENKQRYEYESELELISKGKRINAKLFAIYQHKLSPMLINDAMKKEIRLNYACIM
eukprot:1044352_1